jgi:nicotinamidase/pyrazinamidase
MIYSVIIVDCQNDFISGSLPCQNGDAAVAHIIDFLNEQDEVDVFYSLDWHSPNHQSFRVNGGPWPVHCVAGTPGAELHEDFYDRVERSEFRPQPANRFYKGTVDDQEEYSACKAVSEEEKVLEDQIRQHVIVCGLASEYCVRETALELLDAEHQVSILENGVGYIDEAEHLKNMKELQESGIDLI